MLEFDSPKEQSSYIKVIGVGGGGSNAVNNMYAQGIQGVDFIVCNTDMKSLNNSPVPNKIILGELGAGNIPEVARKAALEHKDDIREAIVNNTQMLFITAGMGGGTGTGAAPVIAEIAKQIELEDETVKRILVVAIVTVPFTFEGRRRHLQAESGIEELRKHVDSILVINNDKLRQLGNLTFREAFKQADDVLYTAVKGIAEIITVSAYVNIDFHDVNTVMENSGTALMGAGVGTGETRAKDAIVAASTSVLLNDNDISGAKNILLYFSYSPNYEISMDELGEVTDYITQITGNIDTDVIWGAGADDNLGDELKITLIATGFEKKLTDYTNNEQPRVIPLGETAKEETPKIQITQNDGEMRVITRETPIQQNTAQQVPEATQYTQPIINATTAVAATEMVHQNYAQAQPATIPHMEPQPAQQQFVSPTPTQPKQPVTTGHVYVLDGDNISEIPQNAHTTTEQNRHSLYDDGINMIQHKTAEEYQTTHQPTVESPKIIADMYQNANQQPIAEAPRTIADMYQSTYQQPFTETPKPVVEMQSNIQQTIGTAQPVSVQNIIPLDMPEDKAPEPAILEPILTQSRQVEVPLPDVALDEAPAQVETPTMAQTEDPDKAALERARKIERIRTLHDLLRNKPDGPSIVENMRTEELTNDEIYRAPHSSQSEVNGTSIDRKGNMKSINNFLFGRPD